jgi:hypothetical protein
MENFGGLIFFLIVIVVIWIYILPTIIAYSRKREAKATVLIINLFFGWSLIGWGIALYIALIKDDEPEKIIIQHYNIKKDNKSDFEKLIKLNELLEKNILTKEEFEIEKQKILK